MAFINKHTFEITHKMPSFYSDWEGTFFEVDELIAPAVSKLNNRGYRTISSCSGHVFPEFKSFSIGGGIKKKRINNFEPLTNCAELSGLPYVLSIDNCYIIFKKVYEFKSIPEGFYHQTLKTNNSKHSVLYARFNSADGSFEKVREIVNAMETLYLWASKIPQIYTFRYDKKKYISLKDFLLIKKTKMDLL